MRCQSSPKRNQPPKPRKLANAAARETRSANQQTSFHFRYARLSHPRGVAASRGGGAMPTHPDGLVLLHEIYRLHNYFVDDGTFLFNFSCASKGKIRGLISSRVCRTDSIPVCLISTGTRNAGHSTPHRQLDLFEGLGKKAISIPSQCSITKCAEEDRPDGKKEISLGSLHDGLRSIGHTAVFCVRNQGIDASGNFGQCVISREILPQSLRLFPLLPTPQNRFNPIPTLFRGRTPSLQINARACPTYACSGKCRFF